MRNKLALAALLALLAVPLYGQTIRPTRISQLRLTELTTVQEGTMTLVEGDVWYNTDLDCVRLRLSASTVCTVQGAGANVRYVAKTGSDSSNGLSWAAAKLTVSAAVQSLPRFGSGGTLRYVGTVYVGQGTFTETDTPIPVNANVQIFGSGVASSDAGAGTVIKLGDGQNTHLIAPEATFTDWAHFVVLKDLTLDGNKANNVGSFDLLRILRPGFNAALYNVSFRDPPRYGLKIIDNAVSFFSYNLTASGCETAAIHINFEVTANLGSITFFGTQIDDCGATAPIQVDSSADGNNFVAFYGLETEASTSSFHDKVIQYTPTAGANGVTFDIRNISAFRSGGGGTAVIYEEAGAGAEGRFNLGGIINASDYTNAFQSAKTSNLIAGTFIGAVVQDTLVLQGSSDLATFNIPSSGLVELDKAFQATAFGAGRVSATDGSYVSTVSASNIGAFRVRVTGDSFDRVNITPTELQVGPGNIAPDSILLRTAADELGTGSGDGFKVSAALTALIVNPLEGALSNTPRWIFKQVDHTDLVAAATADDFVLWTLPANTMIHDVVGTVVTAWEAVVGLSAAVCSVGTAAGSANDLTLDDDFFAIATVYELHDATASGGKGALLFDATDKFAPFMFVAGGNIEIQCDLTGDDHADTNAGQARIYMLVSQPLANTTTEAN